MVGIAVLLLLFLALGLFTKEYNFKTRLLLITFIIAVLLLMYFT